MGVCDMSGLTWARNESDDQALSLKELSDSFLKLKSQMKPLRAVRISRLTLLKIPLTFSDEMNPNSICFYGVPVIIDDSLELFQYIPVYASVTCWLCGGSSTDSFQCHNHGKGHKPAPCNLVCNACLLT